MTLLSTIQTKVGKKPSGSMYIGTKFEGRKLQTIVDTRADIIYMEKELANEIDLPCKKKAYVKGVNAKNSQSMELHMVLIFELGHKGVRSTYCCSS